MPIEKVSTFPCNPSTQRLVGTKLSVDSKGEKIAYVNGRTVVVRDLRDPTKCITYSQHTQPCTLARISPSGFYVASADTSGSVRIWDLAGNDQILKYEGKVLGGSVRDLDWDEEGKRVIVVGDGRERFGVAFFVDGGSSCGEIQGSSKPINAVSIKKSRPYRAVTASDDASLVLFTGVPFKSDKVIRTHTNFIQDVRFSPTGHLFVSVGSDGKMFFFNGLTGEQDGEPIKCSEGTIMGVSWSGDGGRVVTCSADRSVKIWDVKTRELVRSWTIGTDVGAQQNGVVWANEKCIVSIGLDGVLNLIDPMVEGSWETVHGPTRTITSSIFSSKPNPTLYTGSFDGTIRAFEMPSGKCTVVQGQKGDGQITGLAVDDLAADGKVVSTGWGGGSGLRVIVGKEYDSSSSTQVAADGSKGIAISGDLIAIADVKGVTTYENGKQTKSIPGSKDGYSSVALGGHYMAFGGADKKIHLTDTKGENETIFDDSRGEVISLAFSRDAKYLVGGDSSGRTVLIDVAEKKVLVGSRWTSHTSRVNSLSWNPDGIRIVSGGLDESIYIWNAQKTLKKEAVKNAHAGGVTGVAWLDENTIVSTGADACVRIWKVSA